MTIQDIHTVKTALHELASQVYILATGLQNAAPPGPMPASIRYLLDAAESLEQISATLDPGPHHPSDKEQQQQLIETVRAAIEKDDLLRKKYDVQNKFRFISDRLQVLLANLEGGLKEQAAEETMLPDVMVGPDDIIVYAHLFNTHGVTLRSWQSMLIPKVFYEYSVNRPIYAEKNQIEAIIKAKPNRAQHAYLMMAIKKTDIQLPALKQKDTYGNELLKIREGCLHFSRMIAFVHNDIDYTVNDKGELVIKQK